MAFVFISGSISFTIMLFWLLTFWLKVVLTTAIPCLEVSLILIFAGFSVLRTVLLELLPISPNTHILPLLESLFIGCLLNIVLFSR